MARAVHVLLLVHAASAQFDVTFGGGGAGRVEYFYRPLGRGGGGGFGGIVPGAIVLAVSVGLLWWNEGRTLREERMLHEARRAVLSIDGGVSEAGVRAAARYSPARIAAAYKRAVGAAARAGCAPMRDIPRSTHDP